MSWQNEMVLMLRYLVDDFVEPYTYSDSRLEEVIVIGAQLTVIDVDFPKEYVTDVDSGTISPDPTDSIRDNAFINLVVLKSACILLNAQARTKGGSAIKVKDGPSEIDMGASYKALQERAKQACEDFGYAKVEYQAGNSRAGEAILGPYTVERIGTYPGNFN